MDVACSLCVHSTFRRAFYRAVRMGSASVRIPEVLETVPVDGVAAVERWAAQCRAELSRRALELPMIIRRAAQLEAEVDRSGDEPSSVLEAVDADLDAARVAATTAVAQAEAEASAIVERAAAFAANIVRLSGLDPLSVAGLQSSPPSRSSIVFRTRTAADLWSGPTGPTGTSDGYRRFFGSQADDPMAHDPDREFWSEVAADRSPFGRIRRRVAEQRR